MDQIISLDERRFAGVFGEMTDRVRRKIEEVDLRFTHLSPEERDACILQIVRFLMDADIRQAGEHRRMEWEEGWSRNLSALQRGDEDPLMPHYFKNDQIARWRQEFVKPVRPGFDRGGLSIIMEWLFEKYMLNAPAVYEFGCGTGHHLLQLQSVNPDAELFGLDWAEASQSIIGEMAAQGKLRAQGLNFDFFHPDRSLKLRKDAVVYTVGALEQVGERHGAFVDYLLEAKPALCVHVEPIAEVLDKDNLLDYLAISYFRRRNYLWGFLSSLTVRERTGSVRVRDVRRTFLGGNMYVDHYTVVVWSPR